MTAIDRGLTRHGLTAMALLLATMILTAYPIGGGGGSGSGGGDSGTRETLRKDYNRDPGAFKSKWGLPK